MRPTDWEQSVQRVIVRKGAEGMPAWPQEWGDIDKRTRRGTDQNYALGLATSMGRVSVGNLAPEWRACFCSSWKSPRSTHRKARSGVEAVSAWPALQNTSIRSPVA